jgi:signal transduction histidine kinase
MAMHPILARPGRLIGYLALACGFGVLFAVLLQVLDPGSFAAALAYAVPMAVVLGFQCLSVRYPVAQLSGSGVALHRRVARLALGLAFAAVVGSAVWCLAGWAWARALVAFGADPALPARVGALLPLQGVLGVLLFALATLAHLLLVAFERSRAAERRALELQVHARDAELGALKAQLDPHFLFNSLNSIAALIGTDPTAARRMCFLMSGFFRKSLGLGRRDAIPLSEEVYLAETFLAIEQVRFGERLRTAFEIEESTLSLAVPPLVLQPLIENAVHHGTAHLVEGGEVRVRARRRDGQLELEVENPCDPERPPSRGAGVGLANVRARLAALHGHRATVDVESAAERFRVRVLLPATPAPWAGPTPVPERGTLVAAAR